MNNKKVIIGAGVAVVALIVLCSIIFGKKTINLNKYITITFDGYSTYGTATVDFDTNKLMSDVTGKDVTSGSGLSLIGTALEFDSAISGDLDKNTNLTNGENVVYKWSVNAASLEKKYKVKFKYKDISKKVEGLTTAELCDVFEGIDVTYSGVEPYSTASIKYNDAKLSPTYYNTSGTTNLSTGDIINIYINDYDIPNICKEYGIIPTSLKKEIVVEDLPVYASKLSQISQTSLDAIKKQSEDIMSSDVASNWDATFNSMTYKGAYLLSRKSNSISTNNKLYVVYEVNATDKYGDFTYYWYCSYNNIIAMSDGTVSMNYTSYTIPKANKYWWDSTPSGDYVLHNGSNNNYTYYAGFKDIDSLFGSCVTKQLDNYSYDSSVQ